MRLPHHDHHACASLDHQFRFQPSAVHCFHIRNNWNLGELRVQFAHRARAFREKERRACFQPIDSGSDRDFGRLSAALQVDQVERNLNGSFHL